MDAKSAAGPGDPQTSKAPAVRPQAQPQSPAIGAFADLVRAHLGWLRGWLGARLRGHEEQELDDLCQEILLKALRGRAMLRMPDRFPAWLYSIATNVWRDYVRKRKR